MTLSTGTFGIFTKVKLHSSIEMFNVNGHPTLLLFTFVTCFISKFGLTRIATPTDQRALPFH